MEPVPESLAPAGHPGMGQIRGAWDVLYRRGPARSWDPSGDELAGQVLAAGTCPCSARPRTWVTLRPTREEKEGSGVASCPPVWRGMGTAAPSPWPQEAASVLGLGLTLSSLLVAGEQTKALVTQLTLFNRILTDLREDIRDQVRRGSGTGTAQAGLGQGQGAGHREGSVELEDTWQGLDVGSAPQGRDVPQVTPVPNALCSAASQVKEMSLIRNTIMECQVCGECCRGSAATPGSVRSSQLTTLPGPHLRRLP